MWYKLAGVLILKNWVWPGVTLICVAKPWIEGSPAPFTCQSLGGSPGSVFSQAITLVPHGVAVGVAVAVAVAVGVAVAIAVAVAVAVAVGVGALVGVGVGVGVFVGVWNMTSTQ